MSRRCLTLSLSVSTLLLAVTGCTTGDAPSLTPGGPATAVVTDVVEAVDGDDLVAGGGEHVVLENRATIPIDMGGWSLKVGDKQLRLGIGRKIEVGAKLDVFTACGTSTPTAVFACQPEEALPDGGGTVTLVDSAGTEVSRLKYG